MFRKSLWVGALLLLPAAAPAATVVTVDPGVRAGLSISPDQVVLGGQLSLRGFAPDWTFDPGLELGLGDDAQVIAINFDGLYHLRLAGSDWRPYVGGGLGVANYSVDLDPPFHDHDWTEVGLNAVIGFRVPEATRRTWFGELRVGLADLPDLKIVGGLFFGR